MCKRSLRNKRGGALVAVVLAMVVLSLLLVSLLGVSLSESKHAIMSEQNLQAFYNARATGISAAKYLVENRNSVAVKGIYNGGSQSLLNTSYEGGTAAVAAQGINQEGNADPDSIRVTSQWTSGARKGNMTIWLQQNLPPPIAGEFGIQSKTSINVNSHPGLIKSNLAAYSKNFELSEPYKFTNAATLGTPAEYLATFPEIGEWSVPTGKIDTPAGYIGGKYEIDNSNNDMQYVTMTGLKITSTGDQLKIITDSDVYIRVQGNFSLLTGNNSGGIRVEGAGIVHILVEGSLELGAQAKFTTGDPDASDRVIFYVPPSGNVPENRKITLHGGPEINVTIVAPDINLEMKGGSIFKGISWVNSFEGKGGVTYIQNPISEDILDSGFFHWPLQITGYSD